MQKGLQEESGLRSGLGVTMVVVHFINAAVGFYIPPAIMYGLSMLTGRSGGLWLIPLTPPVLLILHVVNARSVARYKRLYEIRGLINVMRIVTDLALLLNILGLSVLLIAEGLLMTATLGLLSILSWIGVGWMFGLVFWYALCCNLATSAYTIAEIRIAYREGYMGKALAVMHTILQLIPFLSFIDGIVVYATTGGRNPAAGTYGEAIRVSGESQKNG